MKRIIAILTILIFIGGYALIKFGAGSDRDGQQTDQNSNVSSPVETNSVVISDFAYSPATITVAAGTEVVFVNNDSVAHTVTADDGSFDSSMLSKGKEFRYTFNTPGTYSYYCTPHPYMKGKVEVK